MSTKEKWAVFYGIASTVMFFVFLVSDFEGFGLLAIFYAINSAEYRIRADVEGKRL